MENVKLKNLKYFLIPGKLADHRELIELHNKTFKYWKSAWEVELAKIHPDHKLNCDDFLRQDIICVITNNEDIVATHLYSFFNIDSLAAINHSYMSLYNSSFNKVLEKENIKTVMSMEYLTINPDYRKKITGISLAEILIALGQKVFKESDAQAIIAPARNDYKVSDMAYSLGFSPILKNQLAHNVSVDYIKFGKSDEELINSNHPDFFIYKTLWKNKQSFLDIKIKSHKLAA